MNKEACQSRYARELAGEGPRFQEKLETKLRCMNLILPEEKLLGFYEIYDWKRGGEETYIAAARLDTDKGTREFISKAILSFEINEKIKSMMRRKKQLEGIGIRTPQVYSIGEGCINQEYIPLSPKEALKNPERAEELAIIASRLDQAGFHTLNFVRDLRADEQNWYYTDWGFDLGEQGRKNKNALATLLRIASEEFPELTAALKKAYESYR